ncbi:major facilitator superfamily transporter [Xylariaceae sp. FL0594]|nr:major facilitator superfamily transporter [Xylariaceae sp. FL0594]
MSDSESTKSAELQLPHQEMFERLSRHSSSALTIRRQRTLGQFSDIVRAISNQDAESAYRIQGADNGIRLSRRDTNSADNVNGDGASPPGSLHAPDGRKIISWEPNDKENPNNWSDRRRSLITIMLMMIVNNSTIGSALPSMAVPFIAHEWGVTSDTQVSLPISTYLIGYVFGPLLWGPLSEHVGRRRLTVFTFLLFCLWTLGCALAPSFPSFLVFRLLCGIFGSSPIAIVSGQIADMYDDPVPRGRALSYFMVTTIGGPLIAPIISGFCSTTIGWRWAFWVALSYAGVTFVFILFLLPETYAPVLLTRRAQNMRKADPTVKVYAAFELERKDMKQVVTRVLTRPVYMILTELIVSATCLYLALVYAIFYISFAAFPIIFQELYGLSPGVTGLLFLPIFGGALIALGVFFAWNSYLRRAQEKGRPWTKKEEYNRVPLAALAGPVFVVSLLWLGFSSRKDIHFIVPSLSGFAFGFGFQLTFIGMLNYLTDAYEIYAASANAASSSTRSLFAVVLPLATRPMFRALGISGALGLLAGLSLLLGIVPFIFLWKGERIRAGSRFCMDLKERKLEMQKNAAQERGRVHGEGDDDGEKNRATIRGSSTERPIVNKEEDS